MKPITWICFSLAGVSFLLTIGLVVRAVRRVRARRRAPVVIVPAGHFLSKGGQA